MISRQPDMELVGEAENGETAIRLAHETSPDVIIMDLQMPVVDGATADAARALDAGALGAISKDSAQDRLLAAIHATAQGESVIDDDIRMSAETYHTAPKLSARQIEILDYASRGLENAEIARLIGISADGVKKHLKLIYAALGASTRAEAAALALRLGLIG